MRILYANHFAWAKPKIETVDKSIGSIERIDFNLSTSNNEGVFPTHGKVVGFMLLIEFNDANGENQMDMWKYDGTTRTNLLTITIPAGQTGCFYSDPDISEAARDYTAGDIIGFDLQKISGSFSRGVDKISIMAGIETESHVVI